jgi:hypothetical protein
MCKKRFNTLSALLLHLENGSCPSILIRVKLNKIIIQQDIQHLTTFQRILDKAGSCASSQARGSILILLCSSLSSLKQSRSYNSVTKNREVILLDKDWKMLLPHTILLSFAVPEDICLEGDCISGIVSIVPLKLFICPLCPPTSNQFRTARDLWNHETLPVYMPKLFYCPIALSIVNSKNARKSAKQSFSMFSGLAMHIESGA